MRITTLLENSPNPQNPALKAEHGLSFYIEHRGRFLMSDLGATAAFADNANLLGVDLNNVEAVTISHHHYDHGGGMARFFTENNRATIHLRQSDMEDFIAQHGTEPPTYIGLDQAVLVEQAGRMTYLEKSREILPGVHVLTQINITHPTPSGNEELKMVRDGKVQVDQFLHEIVTVLEGETGLVVLTGCAHNGVLNMIETVREVFPDAPISAVIGGFHLCHETPESVREVGEALDAMDIPAIYTGHCTGENSVAVLEGVLGEKLHRLYTGLVIKL